MEENDLIEICPTCGQTMKCIKSKKIYTHPSVSHDDTDISPKPFDILKIWQCLNCDEQWEKEIMKNTWRKK